MPTILITGANRGIGLELTRQYAADGWNVLACCRSPENARDLNKLAAQSGGNVSIHLLDLANDAQRASLAAQLKGKLSTSCSIARAFLAIGRRKVSGIAKRKNGWMCCTSMSLLQC